MATGVCTLRCCRLKNNNNKKKTNQQYLVENATTNKGIEQERQIYKERTNWCLAAFVLALTTLLLLRLISQVLVITQTHKWMLTFPTELYVVQSALITHF